MPTMPMNEKELRVPSGGLMLLVLLLVLVGSIALFAATSAGAKGRPASALIVVRIIGAILAMIAAIIGFAGLFVVNPNEGRVMQLFGRYVGTVKQEGLRWTNPFYSKRQVSLRV